MDKLVKLIVQKVGLDEAVAKQVVDVVVSYLKQNLPPPLNQNVEKLVGGEISDVSQIAGLGKPGGGLGGLLGKLFGGKK